MSEHGDNRPRYSWLEILTMVLIVASFSVTTILIEIGYHEDIMGWLRPILIGASMIPWLVDRYIRYRRSKAERQR